jgi:hemerythrin
MSTGGTAMLWNSTLETGIPVIDEQHKELFRQVDILLDTSNKNRINETLDFLGQYVIKHFTAEEVMHARSGYPKAAEHKKMHVAFVGTYKALRDEYVKTGMSLPTLMKINNTAVNWLKEHIMREDKNFAVFYKQN